MDATTLDRTARDALASACEEVHDSTDADHVVIAGRPGQVVQHRHQKTSATPASCSGCAP